MMTIADIFDALTATDRPYKPAVSVTGALDILGRECQAGAIDAELFDVFVAERPWAAASR
jgi:HD-GYP domain-containing protein (c-di-GMP phosphodiesterase class II)